MMLWSNQRHTHTHRGVTNAVNTKVLVCRINLNLSVLDLLVRDPGDWNGWEQVLTGPSVGAVREMIVRAYRRRVPLDQVSQSRSTRSL
jgi:hypothetical protein